MAHTRIFEIRDHAGKWMPLGLPSPSEGKIASEEDSEAIEIRSVAMKQAMYESSWRGRTILLVLAILVGVATAFLSVVFLLIDVESSARYPKYILFAILTIGAILLITSPILAQLSDRRRIISIFVRECLDREICPSCGYRLHGLSRDSASLTACPECNAVWRQIGRVLPNEP